MFNPRRVGTAAVTLLIISYLQMKPRQSLSQYDYRPPEMLAYLRHYGYHFSRRMHDFAVSLMRRDNKPITPWTKEKVEQVIHKYGITLENAIAYDHVYVFNMALADIYGSSITDERALALFVKDYVDDEDQPDGFIFNRFYADCALSGTPIPWEDMLGPA